MSVTPAAQNFKLDPVRISPQDGASAAHYVQVLMGAALGEDFNAQAKGLTQTAATQLQDKIRDRVVAASTSPLGLPQDAARISKNLRNAIDQTRGATFSLEPATFQWTFASFGRVIEELGKASWPDAYTQASRNNLHLQNRADIAAHLLGISSPNDVASVAQNEITQRIIRAALNYNG